MVRSCHLVALVAGCGRVQFDAAAMDARIELDANTVTPCVRDDFDDLDATGWSVLDGVWIVTAGTGRDGSPAIVAGGAGNHTITPAAASEYRSGRIAIDFRIDGATRGDFVVYLYKNPMIEFSVAIHPVGSDNPTDTIRRSDQGLVTILNQRNASTSAATWHRVEIGVRSDGAFAVALDDLPYLASGPDAAFAPPFLVAVNLYDAGAFDSVEIDCGP